MIKRLTLYLFPLLIVIGLMITSQTTKAKDACVWHSWLDNQGDANAICPGMCPQTYPGSQWNGQWVGHSPNCWWMAWECSACGCDPIPCKCDNGQQIVCDESLNSRGPNKCETNCDCTEGRTCVNGWCQGTSYTQCQCTNGQQISCDESKNPGGPGKCKNNCECATGRHCLNGQCADSDRCISTSDCSTTAGTICVPDAWGGNIGWCETPATCCDYCWLQYFWGEVSCAFVDPINAQACRQRVWEFWGQCTGECGGCSDQAVEGGNCGSSIQPCPAGLRCGPSGQCQTSTECCNSCKKNFEREKEACAKNQSSCINNINGKSISELYTKCQETCGCSSKASQEKQKSQKKKPTPLSTPVVPPKGKKATTDTSSVAPKEKKVPSETLPVAPKEKKVPSETPPVAPKEKKVPSETPPVAPKEKKVPSETPPVAPKAKEVPSETLPVAPKEKEVPSATPPVVPKVKEVPSATPPVVPKVKEMPSESSLSVLKTEDVSKP